MIKFSLWLPLQLIVEGSSGEVALGGTGEVAQQIFFMFVLMYSSHSVHVKFMTALAAC